jgi:cysteine-rich repeat protein
LASRRTIAAHFALAVLSTACESTHVKADFTGVGILADFDARLPVRRLSVMGLLADGTVPFPASSFSVTASTSTTALIHEVPISIVIDPKYAGRQITIGIEGLASDMTVLASGSSTATLAIGDFVPVRVHLSAPTTCGDGKVEAAERCDDRNTSAGDGCSDRCMVEPGYACIGEPSTCIASAGAVYVDAGASCSGDGTSAHPFCALSAAIASPRAQAILVRAGVYREPLHLTGVRLAIFGEKGAVLDAPTTPALIIDGRSVLTIEHLVIRGGVEVAERGTTASFTACQLGPSGAIGVDVTSDAVLRLERTRVTGNAGGGLRIASGGPHRIVDDIIASNGSATSSIGGVLIAREGAGTKLVNDTIANNTVRAASTSSAAAGVRCDGPAGVINTIVWGNGGAQPLDLLSCGPSHSDIGPYAMEQPPSIGSSFTTDPKLTNDGHIAVDSPCRDRGDPTGIEPAGVAPSTDFDGEERPMGPGVDVGADEVG